MSSLSTKSLSFRLKKCWRKRAKKTADFSDDESSTKLDFFPQFMSLNEDMQLQIISFISDTPFETLDTTDARNMDENQLIDLCQSTLTHTLPFVSKYFYVLLRSSEGDHLWKESLMRRMQKDNSFTWKNGICALIKKWENDNITAELSLHHTNDAESLLKVASRSYQKYHGIAWLENNINQLLFRSVVTGYVRYTGHVFIMPGNAQVGELTALRLFELRYRLLISEVMVNFPTVYGMGEVISGPNYPTFIYANNTPISVGTSAVIVQVKQCFTSENGIAQVIVMPIAHVLLERIWIRPNCGNLHMASVIRMPESTT